ncbi:hypothetical protein SALBM311S_01158 [Streptomyces alboniger]
MTGSRQEDDWFTPSGCGVSRLPARVRAAVRDTFGLHDLQPARNPDGRGYGEAVIRLHADGVRNPLHNDHIARDAQGTTWSVADVVRQLRAAWSACRSATAAAS